MRRAQGTTDGLMFEIVQERIRQDKEWGGASHDDRHHDFRDWVLFIRKQLDNIQMLPGTKAQMDEAMREPHNFEAFQSRMIKVAALAIAAVQSERRKAGR